MIKIIKKNISSIFIIFLLLAFFFKQTNFYRNSYELINIKYEDRLIKVDGYCNKAGIGYINYIKKKYNIKKKIELISSDKEPELWMVYDTNYNSGEATNFIVINLMELNNKIDLEQFNIIDNFQDCYYLTSK